MPPNAPHQGTPETVNGTPTQTTEPVEIRVPATVRLTIPPLAPVQVQAQVTVTPQNPAQNHAPNTPCEHPLSPHGHENDHNRNHWKTACIGAAVIAATIAVFKIGSCAGKNDSEEKTSQTGGAEYEHLPKARIFVRGTSNVNSDGVNVSITSVDGVAVDNSEVSAYTERSHSEGNGVVRGVVTILYQDKKYKLANPEGGLGSVTALQGEETTWSGVADLAAD